MRVKTLARVLLKSAQVVIFGENACAGWFEFGLIRRTVGILFYTNLERIKTKSHITSVRPITLQS
jgi:hypothetical protein